MSQKEQEERKRATTPATALMTLLLNANFKKTCEFALLHKVTLTKVAEVLAGESHLAQGRAISILTTMRLLS